MLSSVFLGELVWFLGIDITKLGTLESFRGNLAAYRFWVGLLHLGNSQSDTK
ncbi:hypothetical protein JW964_03350 [candidate division KSB1 bacterium]|nr:hypothetical protein [candidate division KSB1 bacterium]